MIVGRVAGEITATIRHPFYGARKLLVVDRVDANGEPTRGYVIAVDVVDAGVGETVLVLDEGNGARQVFASTDAPVRSVVVGIIDRIDVTP
ncbi:MAG: ccmL [Acidobacteria bacterium]|nr:ccmL [Acidobacteriota bacterium]